VIGGAVLAGLVHGPILAADAQVVERLTDINPGPADSEPEQLTPAGGIVFFTADDGVTGRDLWRSDCSGSESAGPGLMSVSRSTT
jgi:hypothetical protein